MSGPYREPAKPTEPEKEIRCCGKCWPMVGGCLAGVRWTMKGRFGTVPAGCSFERPEGTPAVVWRNGRWERQ